MYTEIEERFNRNEVWTRRTQGPLRPHPVYLLRNETDTTPTVDSQQYDPWGRKGGFDETPTSTLRRVLSFTYCRQTRVQGKIQRLSRRTSRPPDPPQTVSRHASSGPGPVSPRKIYPLRFSNKHTTTDKNTKHTTRHSFRQQMRVGSTKLTRQRPPKVHPLTHAP